jgi:hypothetical protein
MAFGIRWGFVKLDAIVCIVFLWGVVKLDAVVCIVFLVAVILPA